MRIACPSCAAEYEVPASRLRPGKLVGCARCGNKWLPALETEKAVPPHAADVQVPLPAEVAMARALPEVTAMDRLAATPASPPSRASLVVAWVLTFVVLAGALAAMIGWRDKVVRAWPPSGRILTATSHSTHPRVQTAGTKAE
jgi:predicted Zn finger-like uncharacterized protein